MCVSFRYVHLTLKLASWTSKHKLQKRQQICPSLIYLTSIFCRSQMVSNFLWMVLGTPSCRSCLYLSAFKIKPPSSMGCRARKCEGECWFSRITQLPELAVQWCNFLDIWYPCTNVIALLIWTKNSEWYLLLFPPIFQSLNFKEIYHHHIMSKNI